MNPHSSSRGYARRFLGFSIVAALFCTAANAAVTFSLTRDFSIGSNPNGVWSYGYTPTLGGPFTSMAAPRTDEVPSIPIWSWSVDGFSSPDVHFNASASNTFRADGGTFPPKSLWVAPGHETSGNAFVVMRFTAPTNGNYKVQALARSYIDEFSGDTDFHVLTNGAEVVGAFLAAGAQQISTSNLFPLVTGDTVDLAVGRGRDNQLHGSALKLEADITLLQSNVPPPVSTNAVPVPSGLVAWWPFEGNGFDASGRGHGMSLLGTPAFGPGEVRQSLVVDGVNDYGQAAPHSDLDLGASSGLTIEMWVNPSSTAVQQPLLEWTDASSIVGLHFWISVVSPWAGGGDGSLFANLTDRSGTAHHVSSAPGVVPPNAFTHVAMSYSRASGLAKLYANGHIVASTNIGSITPETRNALYAGWRPIGGEWRFTGKLDEISLYNRELSLAEIAAIAHAGPAGKSGGSTNAPPPTNPPPPVVHGNFDISRDFAISNNPTGVWSYGWKSNFAGALGLLADVRTFSADNGVPIRAWERATYNHPVVAKVLGPDTAVSDGGRFTAPGGTVYFASGSDGTPHNYGVIRFTAPTGGNYRVEAAVHQLFDSTRSQDSDFHVLKDGVEIFGVFLAPNSSTNFTGTVSLNAGATLEFAVGRGADGLTADSGLKIAALITPTTNGIPPSTNTPVLSGLVGWWPANGNAIDVVHSNNGTLLGGAAFGGGIVGQAFAFDTNVPAVRIPAHSNLNVGTGGGFTIELWVNPSDLSRRNPLIEWNNGSVFGAHLHLDPFQNGPGMQPPSGHTGGPGSIYAAMNLDGQWHQIVSDGGLVASNTWSHVAWTYDKASGMARLFYNGTIASEQTFGDVTAETAYDLFVGRRPAAPPGNPVYSFQGLIDEVSLYNRALAPSEIQSIYNAGGAGKNPTNGFGVTPRITAQPLSRSVVAGGTVVFSVAATGTAPLSYQWLFNENPLAGRNGSSLVLSNVQLANAGNYRVVISNAYGAVLSSNAMLTIVSTADLPAIVSLTPRQIVPVGSPVSFTVIATGAPPLRYRWRFNNLFILGATNATFSIASAQPTNAGNYSVIVSNNFGGVVSAPITLTVTNDTPNPPPVVNEDFDVSRDFAMSTNPAGVWSYGWKSNFAGALELLADVRTFSADNGVPIRAWERTTYNLPVVAKVLGTNTAISDGGRFTAPGGTIYFAPGSDGTPHNYGVVRFTAPTGGNYQVEAIVNQLFDSTRSRDSDFHVLRNGAEVFGVFLAPNTGTNYTGVVSLNAGETLEFAVGRGADGVTADSGLKLAARIAPTTNEVTVIAASSVAIAGPAEFFVLRSRVFVNVEQIANIGDNRTGRVRLQLWAWQNSRDEAPTGHVIATAALPRLRSNEVLQNIKRVTRLWRQPKSVDHITLTVEEQVSVAGVKRWQILDVKELEPANLRRGL